jgi:hypothetical protein
MSSEIVFSMVVAASWIVFCMVAWSVTKKKALSHTPKHWRRCVCCRNVGG